MTRKIYLNKVNAYSYLIMGGFNIFYIFCSPQDISFAASIPAILTTGICCI
jgi:3-methyladenine DNA glycosylase Mpg